MNQLSLYELNQMVRKVLDLSFDGPLWVQAELSEVRESRGHCYVEFVQKDISGQSFVAKARGQVWARKWAFIGPMFERVTGQKLSAGMSVLALVEVTFHELYGYSLNIVDIDPSYTLGDIARRRLEIMERLKAEGVDTMNKELPLPALLQRIAVISSETAAGYGDFVNQLKNNAHGLAFSVMLFPAIMQGDGVERSVISALNAIAEQMDEWDVVVIIRGGGAVSDLSGFDTLALAENVAQFPLPVITGIGHERDDTVIDLVAHTRVKTPTAVAEFLIHHQEEQLRRLESFADSVHNCTLQIIGEEKQRISVLTSRMPSLAAVLTGREQQRIERMMLRAQNYASQHLAQLSMQLEATFQRMQVAASNTIQRQHSILDVAEGKLVASDPVNILRLGYSITRVGGKAVSNVASLQPGDIIETTLADGTVTSIIEQKNNK